MSRSFELVIVELIRAVPCYFHRFHKYIIKARERWRCSILKIQYLQLGSRDTLASQENGNISWQSFPFQPYRFDWRLYLYNQKFISNDKLAEFKNRSSIKSYQGLEIKHSRAIFRNSNAHLQYYQ